MKKLLSLSLFLSLTFFSCSTDEDFENVELQSETSTTLSHKENPHNWNPANTANSYDAAGNLYRMVLEEYYDNVPTSTTPSQIISDVETIANGFSEFAPMKNNIYMPLAYSNIDWILTTNNSYHIAITNNNSLSATAKNQLEVLTNNLILMIDAEATAKSIHDYIVGFEATILSNQNLTANDKKTILTSSSIARHANYLRRKGRRWDIHHGITGSIQGDTESMAKAITTAASVYAIGNSTAE